jgi:glycosyltransferase involved in cell wall biosynthesis
MTASRVEVVLVVHNEEATIESTIREFLALADVELLVAEDGSSDRTRELAGAFGSRVRLTPPSERKGYSRAVADAVAHTRGDVVVFCDGDGQYEPRDLTRLVEEVRAGTIVAGARSPRRDSRSRMLASGAFGVAYKRVVPLRMHDPSSPFVAALRADLDVILTSPPVLPQAFWWEFFARAQAAGLSIVEVPVEHRPRPAGQTQVYRLSRLPRIVFTHLVGLVRLRRELRRTRRAREAPPIVPASIAKPR